MAGSASVNRLTFVVGIRRILDRTRGSNPASFVQAVDSELDGPMEALARRLPAADAPAVRWILMELVTNGYLLNVVS
jgi:hypothetical protein